MTMSSCDNSESVTAETRLWKPYSRKFEIVHVLQESGKVMGDECGWGTNFMQGGYLASFPGPMAYE